MSKKFTGDKMEEQVVLRAGEAVINRRKLLRRRRENAVNTINFLCNFLSIRRFDLKSKAVDKSLFKKMNINDIRFQKRSSSNDLNQPGNFNS